MKASDLPQSRSCSFVRWACSPSSFREPYKARLGNRVVVPGHLDGHNATAVGVAGDAGSSVATGIGSGSSSETGVLSVVVAGVGVSSAGSAWSAFAT